MTTPPGNGAPPFHHAVTVDDLAAAEDFYGELLGCARGRRSAAWIDFDFFGHQLTVHLDPAKAERERPFARPVDGEEVPVPHFGVVLDMPRWRTLAGRLEAAGVEFVLAPTVRFAGQIGEQATLFLRDPAGNALEFKAFERSAGLFEHDSA